jgi:hypothetical protein
MARFLAGPVTLGAPIQGSALSNDMSIFLSDVWRFNLFYRFFFVLYLSKNSVLCSADKFCAPQINGIAILPQRFCQLIFSAIR